MVRLEKINVMKYIEKKCARYLVSAIVGGWISVSLIYGQRVDQVRQIAHICAAAAAALGLTVGAALVDAIPPRIFSRRARMWFASFVCVYKSASANIPYDPPPPPDGDKR